MSVVSAIHASAAVLLVLAGAAKLSRPAQGVADLLGFRAPTPLVRLVGASEAAVGIAALFLGGPTAWAVGLLYACFALVVLRAVLVGAGSCGCFGRLDAPPSWVHVLGNLALAAVSFAAVGADSPPVPAIAQSISDRPAVGVALAAEIVLMAGLGLATFTALPEALGARTSRRGAASLFRSVTPPAAGLFRSVTPPDASSAAAPGSGRRR